MRWAVAAEPARAREVLLAPLRAQGWRTSERTWVGGKTPAADGADGADEAAPAGGADGSALTLQLERGRLGRSVLLGSLAGRHQHLALRIDIVRAPRGSTVECSWSPTSPRSLGGSLGARRAERTMRATTAALRSALADAGLLVVDPG